MFCGTVHSSVTDACGAVPPAFRVNVEVEDPPKPAKYCVAVFKSATSVQDTPSNSSVTATAGGPPA